MIEGKPVYCDGSRIPRVNMYVCQYGCRTITVDVDHGVTPFAIKCRRKPTEERPIDEKYLDKKGECSGEAHSNFYPTKGLPTFVYCTHEWYMPSEEEIEAWVKKHPDSERVIRDEFKSGILLLRARTEREPVYHCVEEAK